MKNEHCVTVLFGSDQIRKFHNREIFSEEDICLYTKYYSFDTEQELNAFILGIEEANGWLDLIYFKDLEISHSKQRIKSTQVITADKVKLLQNK